MRILLAALDCSVSSVNDFIFLKQGKEENVLHRNLFFIFLFGLIFLISPYLFNFSSFSWLYSVMMFPVSLLYGPLLLLFITDLQEKKRTWDFSLNFVPFYVCATIYLIIFFNPALRYRYNMDYAVFIQFFSLLHLGTYILYIETVVFKKQEDVRKARWRKVSWYILFLVVVSIQLVQVTGMVRERGNFELQQVFALVQYFLFMLGAWKIYCYYRKSGVNSLASRKRLQVDEPLNCEINIKKTTRPYCYPISKENEAIYRARIEIFILTLSYLDSDLNKDRFSDQLNIPEQEVTLFIKHEFGKNFNGFINQLRLNYASKLLKSSEMVYKIEELSHICGFNSRASFYRNFNAEFGCSPHQYRLESTTN